MSSSRSSRFVFRPASACGKLGAMRHVVVILLLIGCGEVKDKPPIESCTPNEFVRCDGSVAQICNAAGDGAEEVECGDPGCNEGAARCNACVPDSATCGAGLVERC